MSTLLYGIRTYFCSSVIVSLEQKASVNLILQHDISNDHYIIIVNCVVIILWHHNHECLCFYKNTL